MTSCPSFALRSGFCLAVACVYISTSLLVAFFPRAAMSRGLSQIDIGIVFAILPAIWLLTAPIWANYASRIGPRFLIIGGVGVISLCMFAISILEPMKTRGPFLAACLVIRAIQGAASAATMTGNYVLVASVYPNALGEVIGGL
jgi:MFS family permease